MERIYIVILNYNGWRDTVECVESFYKQVSTTHYQYTIVIIDNKSTDDSFNKLEELLPTAILIESDFNGGYAYGNNIGIRYAMEHNADYICILNNDTVLVEDFFQECITVLRSDNTIAFVGPTLINYSDDLVQSTGGNVSFFKGKTYKWNEGKDFHTIPKSHVKTDIIFGAAMVFRTDLLKDLGIIPENYFLFYEETEWCYKARKLGYTNIYITEKRIRHKGSASLVNLNDMQTYLMERNRVLFIKRNGTPVQLVVFLIYDTLRMIYRSFIHHVPFITYMKFHLDGLTESFNAEYVDIHTVNLLKKHMEK